MVYFTPDYLEFFKELAANNHKEWFDVNRKRYESVVRDPFKNFISELISVLSKSDPDLNIEAKDAIFRINRDIRFSKDKTPYKLNNSAIITPGGRKNKNHPGIYLEFGPEKMAFYGGIYMPSSKEVQKIREYIVENQDQMQDVLNASGFKDTFGEVHGEKNKRIPKEFIEIAEHQPLLYNKQWYYYTHLPSEKILSKDLLETILDLKEKAEPMKKFLSHAILD